MSPRMCSHPACNKYGYSDYCSRHEPFTVAPATSDNLRGIGCVTPPAKVRYSAPKRVRRSDGYIARNGAWITTQEAGYLELQADVAQGRRATVRNRTKAQASIVAALTPRTSDIALMAQMGTIHNTEG